MVKEISVDAKNSPLGRIYLEDSGSASSSTLFDVRLSRNELRQWEERDIRLFELLG